MIYLKKSEYCAIIKQAKDEFDHECCGFLAGTKKNGNIYIDKVFPMKNTDNSSEHFSMEPKEQFEKIKSIRSFGMEMLGNYHSHPYSPSRPSEEDKRLSFDPNVIYSILSLQNKEVPVLNMFKVIKNENYVEKLQYEIV
ncbi:MULTISPECIES: M67 family metallopeptidase [Clostridium]|uniref:M67 family metallopeptidase n=1 Tax=Clostridium TaxID=1485 RepID=UPI0008240ADF|nr:MULTISPECIES: M67 family metallopeptidase [Clostridium]PJI08279.1 hypothetical protein CUB90_10580 [Clostridium sp. CT7]